jgi:hypothetical protein
MPPYLPEPLSSIRTKHVIECYAMELQVPVRVAAASRCLVRWDTLGELATTV